MQQLGQSIRQRESYVMCVVLAWPCSRVKEFGERAFAPAEHIDLRVTLRITANVNKKIILYTTVQVLGTTEGAGVSLFILCSRLLAVPVQSDRSRVDVHDGG